MFGLFGNRNDEFTPEGSPIARATIDRSGSSPQQRAPLTEEQQEAREAERMKREDQTKRETVAGLQEIMDGDDFVLNPLSDLSSATYKIKLFMTAQREVVTKAKVNSIQAIYSAIDSLPQAILAESGVTAGFNIGSVTMEEMVAPGFQNRNTGLTTMKIIITEPNGSSFVESIAKSARKLGISNYQQFWYYMEISFGGYDAEGNLLTNALAGTSLASGGRWIYQIKIINCEVKMDEVGATYVLTCQPSALDAFEDTMVGSVPDNLKVTGSTIGEFLENFGTELTKAYDARYLGRLFNFKFQARNLAGNNSAIDPSTFRLQQSEQDPISATELSIATSGSGVTVQIPRGTRVSDVIDYVWASCEDAQKVMLDTKSPYELEDEGATWNGKPYRESVVPKIEPDVTVTGYDPIMNCYMQDIVYNIYGYYTYAPNLSPNQAIQAGKEGQNVGGKIAQRLKDKGYLRKRYDFRYTGLNTEVIRFDLDFNFAFASVLPRLSGWRADIAAVSDQERRASDNENIAGISPTEVSASGTGGADGANPPEQIRPEPDTTYAQSLLSLNSAQQNLSDLEERRKQEVDGENNPQTIAQIDTAIEKNKRYQESLRREFTAQRNNYNVYQKDRTDRVLSQVETFFAEDEAIREQRAAYSIRYRQAGDERSALAAGSGVMGHWHRGGSLTGALLNQLYEPMTTSLVKIDLEIKGDPYWLGLSNLERRAVNLDIIKPDDAYANLPNFSEGDNTFALTLRFPATINGDTGELIFRKDDVFNGLYRCNRIEHTFADGKFTQKITATKLELAQLPASTLTEDDVVVNHIR